MLSHRKTHKHLIQSQTSIAFPHETEMSEPEIRPLSQQAERQIFTELSTQVANEVKHSVFAVGGSIPITALGPCFICESDGEESVPRLSDQDPDRDGSAAARAVNSRDASPAATRKASSSHQMRCDPVTIRWDNAIDTSLSHKVTLPDSPSGRPLFEQLLKDCQPASFGRGGEDVIDEIYRKASKLDESAFCTNFNSYALGIIDTAAQVLAPDDCMQTNEVHGIREELYKLNVRSFPAANGLIYSQSQKVYSSPAGKFKAHVDTPRQTPNRLSSGLPSEFS